MRGYHVKRTGRKPGTKRVPALRTNDVGANALKVFCLAFNCQPIDLGAFIQALRDRNPRPQNAAMEGEPCTATHR